MKKSFSIIYTVCVSVLILGVVLYLGWGLYQVRAGIMADLGVQTESYTRQLEAAMSINRDIDSEVSLARDFMRSDPELTAVQVYSDIDGLRLSVVKPPAEQFSREAITESDFFDGFFYRVFYQVTTIPMAGSNTSGMEAVFVSRLIPQAQFHNSLLIILVTLLALFIMTLVLIIIQRGSLRAREEGDSYGGGYGSGSGESPPPNDFEDFNGSLDNDYDLPEFRDNNKEDSSDSIYDDQIEDMPDSDFTDSGFESSFDTDYPDPADGVYDIPSEPYSDDTDSELKIPLHSEMMERLEEELNEATSNNKDLSLIIYSPRDLSLEDLHDIHDNKDLIFSLGFDGFAVIEPEKDLDSSLSEAEDFIRKRIETRGNRLTRAGIASRNGRLVSAEHLIGEAHSALNRTDADQNIVAFRSDPNKYRDYLSRV